MGEALTRRRRRRPGPRRAAALPPLRRRVFDLGDDARLLGQQTLRGAQQPVAARRRPARVEGPRSRVGRRRRAARSGVGRRRGRGRRVCGRRAHLPQETEGRGERRCAGSPPSSAAAVASASTTARVIRRHGTRRPACSRCPAYRWQRISRPSRGGTGSPVDSSTRGAAPGRARCSMAWRMAPLSSECTSATEVRDETDATRPAIASTCTSVTGAWWPAVRSASQRRRPERASHSDTEPECSARASQWPSVGRGRG